MPSTNFNTGLTTASFTDALGHLPVPDPRNCHLYFEDFDTYNSGDFTVTATGSTTQALTAGEGGLLLITNSAANADICSMQLKVGNITTSTVHDTLAPYADPTQWKNHIFFSAKFKVTTAATGTVVVGLQKINTDPTAAASDGIFFKKDSSGNLTLVVQASSTATTSATLKALADNTFVMVSYDYDMETGVINAFVNNVKVLAQKTLTNLPATSTLLAPTMGVKNSTGTAVVLTVDNILAAKVR